MRGTCGERYPPGRPGSATRCLYPHGYRPRLPILDPGVRSEMETLGRSHWVTSGSPGAEPVCPAPLPLLPSALSSWANLAPIGPGQAVTEAETRVMIGFLGREEVL